MNNTDLIWRNLSDFWARIPDADRLMIETIWEGWMESFDSEYSNLYQYDLAKTLETCPVFSKYRWCLLDLSKKNLAKIKDYITNLRSPSIITDNKKSAINDVLKVSNHVDHRHFYFKPNKFKREISIPFNIEPALIEAYRLTGKELMFGPDYTVDVNKIKLGPTILDGDEVCFFIGINETNLDENYLWNRYSEYANNKSDFILPFNYTNIMVFVDNQYIDQSDLTFDTVNKVHINYPVTGLVEFIEFNKDPKAEFSQFHRHVKQVFIFNPDGISNVGTYGSVSEIILNPPQSIIPDIRYSGPESKIKVFVRGEFFSDWTYETSTGKIIFNSPILWNPNQFTPITVEFTEIQLDQYEIGHIHAIRQDIGVIPLMTSDVFDDSGRFDDNGYFDSSSDINQYTLDFLIDEINSLKIFLNGKLLTNQYDYILLNDKRTLSFNFDIKNGFFRFEYQRKSGRFSYGASDLDGLNEDQIRKANMLLFYNEDKELMAEFDVNSLEEDTKASEAYKLAGQDIYCQSIPVIQNRVDNPDIIYNEKSPGIKGSYSIVNGGLMSDVKMSDYMWCPVVYFDESLLAKNFGVLVDYAKTNSSEAYKQALIALWSGLWNGPIIENIEWVISMFFNVPYIPEDGIIKSIENTLLYTEIVTDSDKYQLGGITTLKVGDKVFYGQSLENKSKISSETSFSSFGENGSTRITIPGITSFSKISDLIVISNGNASGIYSINRLEENSLIVTRPLTGSVGLIQEDKFDNTAIITSSTIYWPQFSNNIEIGSYIYLPDEYETYEIVDFSNKTITINHPINSSKFIIYNKTNYSIVEANSYPFAKRNSIVREINKVTVNTVTVNNLSVDVPGIFDIDVTVGQKVRKYQPTSRQVSVYDDELRKDWLYNKNSAFNEEFASGGNDYTEQILQSVCDINGSWLTDNNRELLGLVRIGDLVSIASGLNTINYQYKVKLVKNNKLLLSNKLVNDTNVSYSIERFHKFRNPEESPKQTSVSNYVAVKLTDDITSSTINIVVDDASSLPISGVVKSKNNEFIKYEIKVGNELRNCTRSFNENIATSLIAGDELKLIFEFESKFIREVFYSGVKSISNINTNALITEKHKDIYNIIKANTTIVELFANSGINQPDLVNISNFLRKILPASSFWFLDLNKGITDVDIRDPEETITLARKHFTYNILSETAIINGNEIIISSAINVNIGDYVLSNDYAKIIDIDQNTLIVDKILTSTNITIFSNYSVGKCKEYEITSKFNLDPLIKDGCTLTILHGINTGVYTINSVSGNIITVNEKFKETGNNVLYTFYVTSNEETL